MKQLITIFITGLFFGQLLSCSNKQNDASETHFKGDLLFKLISIGSLYQTDSLTKAKFNHYLDSLKTIPIDSLTAKDKETMATYGGLKINGLIEKPFFYLRLDSIRTYVVYADTIEYKKIKGFNQQELISENKKVKIELTGDILNLGPVSVINCKTIDKVEKVDGKTYWRK